MRQTASNLDPVGWLTVKAPYTHKALFVTLSVAVLKMEQSLFFFMESGFKSTLLMTKLRVKTS